MECDTNDLLNWIFQIGPNKSSTVIVFFGLPQGTILGPLFYIVYTADIENIIEKHGVKMHLYADDSQLYDHSRTGQQHWAVDSNSTLPKPNSSGGSGALNRKAPTTTADQSQLPRIVKFSIGPRDLGVWSSTPARLWRHTSPSWQKHASISCEEFDRRRKTWTKTL